MSIAVAAVVGPTASGKTALGVSLAKALNGEIISCDSMQIYKGMDIATAKPTTEEQQGIHHHLVDFISPEESYSVARFATDAAAAIKDITARGKLPILVGGTGLYVTSLLDGIRFIDQPQDVLRRKALQSESEEIGVEAMHQRLMGLDPDYGSTLHPNNSGRVIRAIELFEQTGKKMSEQLKDSKAVPSPYLPAIVGINFADRSTLYNRINQRVDAMLENGLLQEAEEFMAYFNDPHNDKNTAAQAIGIKELIPFLEGEQSLASCVERLKQETRRYSKRQLTWFLRDKRTCWLLADRLSQQELSAQAERFIREVFN